MTGESQHILGLGFLELTFSDSVDIFVAIPTHHFEISQGAVVPGPAIIDVMDLEIELVSAAVAEESGSPELQISQ